LISWLPPGPVFVDAADHEEVNENERCEQIERVVSFQRLPAPSQYVSIAIRARTRCVRCGRQKRAYMHRSNQSSSSLHNLCFLARARALVVRGDVDTASRLFSLYAVHEFVNFIAFISSSLQKIYLPTLVTYPAGELAMAANVLNVWTGWGLQVCVCVSVLKCTCRLMAESVGV
jgi:hypothetical protein